MTWTLDPDTGELKRPDGTVETTLAGPPYTIPDDAREWALQELRNTTLAALDTGRLADLVQVASGDIESEGEL